MNEGFATAEAAALASFPPAAHAHVRAVVENRAIGRAVFVVDTRPSHPIEVDCVREDDRWHEMSSGNGWTWAPLDDGCTTGFQTVWDEVPDGVTAVRIEFAGRTAEAPVTNGMFLFVDWRASSDDAESWPHVVGYLQDGKWKQLHVDRGTLRAERLLRARPPFEADGQPD